MNYARVDDETILSPLRAARQGDQNGLAALGRSGYPFAMRLPAVLVLLLSAPALAAEPWRETCANEISLLCPGLAPRKTLSCLRARLDDLLPACERAVEPKEEDESWGGVQLRDETPPSAADESEAEEDDGSPQREARIVGATGPVYIHAAGAAEGVYAVVSSGTPLAAGDWLRVGAGASASLSLDGAVLVALSSGTDLGISSLKSAGTELKLALGALSAKVNKLKVLERFRVRTPTAVCAVRGTEFIVEEDGSEEGSRVAVVDEGEVEVSEAESEESVVLGPREETSVRRGAAPEPPRELQAMRGRAESFAPVRRQFEQTQREWRPMPQARREQLRQGLRQGGPGGGRGKGGGGTPPGLSPGQRRQGSPGGSFQRGGQQRGNQGGGPGGDERRRGAIGPGNNGPGGGGPGGGPGMGPGNNRPGGGPRRMGGGPGPQMGGGQQQGGQRPQQQQSGGQNRQGPPPQGGGRRR